MTPQNNLPFRVNIYGEAAAISYEIQAGETNWHVPEEVPIAFVFSRRNYAVMMGTPENLVDFAIGFSLTEAVVKSMDEIKSMDILLSEKGADLRIKITEQALQRLDITQRRRNMIGSASCGLCGLENVDSLFEVLPKVSNAPIELDEHAMQIAMVEMPSGQILNQKTYSVHAAAWVNLAGDIQLLREDVGRHNAMDKLLGAMVIAGTDVSDGFVLISSRCSYEIVEKAARRGVKAILAISGPTAFALKKARDANMSIYGRSGDGAVRLF